MDKRLLGYINWALLACMLLLYFTGVANLYSASGTRVETGFAFESFYQRQLVWGLCHLCDHAAFVGQVDTIPPGSKAIPA